MPNFDGKTILVTGGGSGIGKATCEHLASLGAQVIVVDRNGDAAQEVTDGITAAGGKAQAAACDVTDEAQVADLCRSITEQFGALDGAVNNAGIVGPVGPISEISIAEARVCLDVDVMAVLICLQHELRQMLAQGSGAIVNTCSIWGLTGAADYATYVAAKHAVAGLTKSAALETAQKNIRVNAVCPGFINTPMIVGPGGYAERHPDQYEASKALHPMNRYGEPVEVAKSIAWLLSNEEASFVTGHLLSVDGGYVVP